MNLNEFLTGIGFFAKYPYTDFHEMNLDWAITEIAKLRVEFDDFAHVNSLKYAGEWDITKSYSAFSVVDDQGFGYMALKPVPPGTQILDTEYWLMVVDYSQITQDYENRISALETTVGDASSGLVKDVDDLQSDMTNAQSDITALQGTVGDASSGLVKDVDDLQTDMTNAQSDIIALQGTVGDASSGLVKDVTDLQTTVGDASSGLVKDVDDLQSDMTTAQGDITNAQGDITALQTAVAALANASGALSSDSKIVCVGDSYGYMGTPWPTVINTVIGPASLQNMCQNGGGIVGNAGSVGYYITQLQSATDKANITHIIIMGGFNDAYPSLNGSPISKTDVFNGLNTIKTYVKNNYPKATLYVGFVGYASDAAGNLTATTERAQCRLMRDYYKDCCNSLNIRYLNNIEYTLHDSTLFDDANVVYGTVFHPSNTGNERLAVNAIACINSGSCSCEYDANITTTAVTGITLQNYVGSTPSTYQMREKFSNGISQIEYAFQGIYMKISGTINMGANSVMKFADISGRRVVFPDSYGCCRSTCACTVEYSDSTKAQCAAQILMQGTEMYLILNDVSGKTITAVNLFPMMTTGQYDIM